MRTQTLILAATASLALVACAQQELAAQTPQVPVAEPAPAALPAAVVASSMPGAVPGSVAADRDGDGIIDGYYTADGIYHPNIAPAPPAPPPTLATRRGERG